MKTIMCNVNFDNGEELSVYLGNFHRGTDFELNFEGRLDLGRQRRENRLFCMVTEKSGVSKDLEAVESKRRKVVKGSQKRGVRECLKNICGVIPMPA